MNGNNWEGNGNVVTGVGGGGGGVDANLVIYVPANSDVCGSAAGSGGSGGSAAGSGDSGIRNGRSSASEGGGKSSNKVLASTYSCFWDQFERPIAGTIDFCLNMIEEDGIDDEDNEETISGGSSSNTIVSQVTASGMGQGQWQEKGQDLGQEDYLDADNTPEVERALDLAVGMAVHEIAHVLGEFTVTYNRMLVIHNLI